MAVVYLAREDHPNRQVAIKVLEPTLTARLGRERFLREVDLASNLSHPHIVPIFAAGDAGGMLYYVMPFVVGESLHERLRRLGKLPLHDALRVASEVADALEYAHQRNVVHRDIKPPNILLQGRHAVVTDFGVARAISMAGTESITETGMTLGTPAYMSPEQATSTEVVDGRADVYSLASVLFEMLTGAPPYGRRGAQEVLVRVLHDPVPSARETDSNISAELDAVLTKALAKSPDDRYPTALDFSLAINAAASEDASVRTTPLPTVTAPVKRDWWSTVVHQSRASEMGSRWLRRVASVGGLAAVALIAWLLFKAESGGTITAETRFIDSVAVMPLDNLTGDSQFDHLGAGITEEIITHLAHTPRLKVISRHSAEAMAGAQLTAPQLLDTLRVAHIIEGSFQVRSGQIQVTVQHIDSTDAHLGSTIYSADLSDWFAAQERIARQVTADFVQQIEGLSMAEAASHAGRSAGHEPYLLGKHWLDRRTPDGIRRAIAFFEEAIRRDAELALAHAKLSSAYALALNYRYQIGVDDYETAALALAHAERALSISPDLADAFAARGYISIIVLGPASDAAADFERARTLKPNSASAHSWYARVLAGTGEVAKAFTEAERAVSLDPLHSGRRIGLAYLALHLGQYDVAIREAMTAASIEPELMLARAIQARALLLRGEALQCAEMSLGPYAIIRATCLYQLGRRSEASVIVDSVAGILESQPGQDARFTDVVRAEDLAVYYAWVGDAEQALRWAKRAYKLSPVGVEARVLESALFDRVRPDNVFTRDIQRVRNRIWNRVLDDSKLVSTDR